jgi:hypothetical protein
MGSVQKQEGKQVKYYRILKNPKQKRKPELQMP